MFTFIIHIKVAVTTTSAFNLQGCDVQNISTVNSDWKARGIKKQQSHSTDDLAYCSFEVSVLTLGLSHPITARQASKLSLVFSSETGNFCRSLKSSEVKRSRWEGGDQRLLVTVGLSTLAGMSGTGQGSRAGLQSAFLLHPSSTFLVTLITLLLGRRDNQILMSHGRLQCCAWHVSTSRGAEPFIHFKEASVGFVHTTALKKASLKRLMFNSALLVIFGVFFLFIFNIISTGYMLNIGLSPCKFKHFNVFWDLLVED